MTQLNLRTVLSDFKDYPYSLPVSLRVAGGQGSGGEVVCAGGGWPGRRRAVKDDGWERGKDERERKKEHALCARAGSPSRSKLS